MKAIAIIEQVRNEGGIIRAEGADILLSAARPLSPELVAQVREHKTEIVRALDEAHMLAVEFERTGRLRIESDWAGPVWLVASAERLVGNEDGSVYFPHEVRCMVQLSPQEHQQLHRFKQHFGGTFEIKQTDKGSKP